MGEADVGFVMLVSRADALQIHTLCVAPEHQGRGIGSKVTMDIIDDGARTGRVVVLSVLKANTRAAALYTRLGFVVIDESKHHHHMRYKRL